jgi:multidrug efflux pump subunit AcrA (membrane-fusion protein)
VSFNIDERSFLRYTRLIGVEGKDITEILAKLQDRKSSFTFALDGETEFAHSGMLAFADNRVDPTTGTIQVYGTVGNKDGNFLPGARVRIRLPIGQPYDGLLVPETAILADQDKRYILIADAENNVRRRNVRLGTLTDDGLRSIQPVDKLDAAESPSNWRVLVDNLQRARINYPIEPLTPDQLASGNQASR